MRNFFNIWKLEFRKQRFALILTMAGFLLLFLLEKLLIQQQSQHNTWIFLITGFALFLTMLVLSSESAGSDSQNQTIPFLFSLPVSPWKIFFAKYTYSLLILCAATFPAAWYLLFREQERRGVVYALFTILSCHAILWFWTLTVRKNYGNFIGLAMIPVTILSLFFLSALILISAISSPKTSHLLIPFFGMGILNFLFSLWTWNRGVVKGRSVRRIVVFMLLITIFAPFTIWCAGQIYWLSRYAIELQNFKRDFSQFLPGNDLMGKESILQFATLKEKNGVNAAIENLVRNQRISKIPYAKFSDYRAQKYNIINILFQERDLALKNSDYKHLELLSEGILNLPNDPLWIDATTKFHARAATEFIQELLPRLPLTQETIPFLEFLVKSLEQLPFEQHYEILLNSAQLPGFDNKKTDSITLIFQNFKIPLLRNLCSKTDPYPAIYQLFFPARLYFENLYYNKIIGSRYLKEQQIKTEEDLILQWANNSHDSRSNKFQFKYRLRLACKAQIAIIRYGKPPTQPQELLTEKEIALFWKYHEVKLKTINHFHKKENEETKGKIRILPYKYYYSIRFGNLDVVDFPFPYQKKNGKYIHRSEGEK